MANESPIDLASISSTAPRMLGGRIHERPLLTWPSTVQPTISYIYDSSPSAFATRPKDAGSSRVDTPGSEKAPTCQSRDSPLRCDTAEASEEGAHKGQDLDVNVDANAESNNRQSVYCCSGTLAFLEAPPIRPNVDTISQKLLEDSTAVAVELVGSAAFKLLGQFRRIVSPRGTRHEKSVSKPGSERSLRIESRVSELGTVGDSEGSGDSFHSFLDGEGAELEPITEQAQEMDDSWTMVENDRVNPSSSPESGYVEDISSGQSTSEEVSSSSSGGIMHQSAPDIEKAKVSFGEEMVIAINLVNGRTPGMPGLIPVKSVSRFSVSQSLTTTPSETGSMTPTAGRILEIGAARKERARGKGRGAQKRVKRQKARALGKVTPPRGGEKYGKLHNDCGYNPRLEEIRGMIRVSFIFCTFLLIFWHYSQTRGPTVLTTMGQLQSLCRSPLARLQTLPLSVVLKSVLLRRALAFYLRILSIP